MLQYNKLTFSGFRSYKNEQVLDLNLNPGVYFFTGKNLVDEVGSNGVGKSTLADSLCWVLYGKTIRGVKGANVINWNSKTTKVSLDLEINNAIHNIARTHTPISLKLDSHDIEQSELEKLLPINYDQFLYAQAVGQFNESFLDLTPTDRLNLFSTIMKLQLWEQAAKKSSELGRLVEASISKLNGTIEKSKSIIESYKSRILDLESNNKSFETERKSKLDSLKEKLELELNTVQQFEKELEDYNKLIDYYNTQKSNLETNSLTTLITELSESINSNKTSIKILENENNSLTKELNKWKDMHGNCLYCNQPVSEDLINSTKKQLTKDIIFKRKDISNLSETNSDLLEKLTVVQKSLTEVNVSNKEIDALISTTQKEVNIANNKLSVSRSQIQTYRKTITDEENRINPYITLIEKEKLSLNNEENSLQENQSKLDADGKDYAAYDFWSKNFKELRLWIVSEALHTLEYESNDILSKLGLGSHKLSFQMEKETTTGNINKGFHIFISSPDSKGKTVPIEVWSGGELQRLKLATTLGLMSLIQSYSGLDSNLLILDEPTHHLSTQGIDCLLEFLDEYASTKHKVIFLIDHNNIESSHFKQIFTVIKDKNGSYIEQ